MLKLTFRRGIRAITSIISEPLYENYHSNSKVAVNMKAVPKLLADESAIVWMDLEMTGLNPISDKIIEIACLITDKDLNVLTDGLSFTINQPKEIFDQMNEWCIKQHGESGLVEKCLKSDITLERAESMLLVYLQKYVPKGKCPLAGNSIYMDRLFLRHQMSSVDNYLHYRVIDISSIKELCRRWRPDLIKSTPKKRLLHRSLEDLQDSIDELKYYRNTFFKTI